VYLNYDFTFQVISESEKLVSKNKNRGNLHVGFHRTLRLFLPGRFGREGEEKGLKLLVDAEYTYMNPGIHTV
jgi:hypothetical protein